MDIFNQNILPRDLWNSILIVTTFAMFFLIVCVVKILKNGDSMTKLDVAISFIDIIKFVVSVISLIIILLISGEISVATLIVAVLAIIEIASSSANILKTIFGKTLEK